jgi:hypothetical protein
MLNGTSILKRGTSSDDAVRPSNATVGGVKTFGRSYYAGWGWSEDLTYGLRCRNIGDGSSLIPEGLSSP